VGEDLAGAPETDIGSLVNFAIHHSNVNIVTEAGAAGADGGFDSGFQKIPLKRSAVSQQRSPRSIKFVFSMLLLNYCNIQGVKQSNIKQVMS
jgi:hypothetical protein